MLRFDKITYLSLLLMFTLSEKLSNSLWGSDVLLFPEFMNILLTVMTLLNSLSCYILFKKFVLRDVKIYNLPDFI